MSGTIYILNGPNLNLLGTREPHIYGHETLADVEADCRRLAAEFGLSIKFQQSNAEYQLIDWIHEARDEAVAIIINPGAFTHTSIAIMDALNACQCPILEVHISNVHRRGVLSSPFLRFTDGGRGDGGFRHARLSACGSPCRASGQEQEAMRSDAHRV